MQQNPFTERYILLDSTKPDEISLIEDCPFISISLAEASNSNSDFVVAPQEVNYVIFVVR